MVWSVIVMFMNVYWCVIVLLYRYNVNFSSFVYRLVICSGFLVLVCMEILRNCVVSSVGNSMM